MTDKCPVLPTGELKTKVPGDFFSTEKDGNVVHYKYPSLAGNYAGFYDNIYRHLLRHGEPLLTDAADVLLVIRLIEAAWKSSKEGNVVKL